MPEVRHVRIDDGVFVSSSKNRKRGNLPGRYVSAHLRRWPERREEYVSVRAYQERIEPPPSDTTAVFKQSEMNLEPNVGSAKRYEGDLCPQCLNFTLVRNGTSLKCDTCGNTTS